MQKPRRSLLLALGVASAIGAYQLGRATAPVPQAAAVRARPAVHPLARTLRERFGPDRHSEDLEEWIIRDVFGEKREGVFLDVGANHHQVASNTYYLETALGWSGVAVEPLVRFAEGYAQYRPRTTFVPLFVSDVADRDAVLYVPKNDRYQKTASGSRAFADLFGPFEAAAVRTVTLDILLDRLRIRRVDFVSLDIEEFEPQALAGFSIRRFAPDLVVVEAHDPVKQQLLEYFSRNGYVLIGKYLAVDSDNFWFAPMGMIRDTPRSERSDPH